MQRRDRPRTGSDLPGLDLAERQAWHHYLDAVLRFDAVLNRLLNAEHQLSVIDLRVLDILAKSADGFARMGDLADALAVTRRQMTKRIDRLEARGLVRREGDPQDRRGVVAFVAEDGRQMVDRARISYAQGVATYLLGPLSARQVSTVAENCWRINQALIAPGRQDSGAAAEQNFPEAPSCYLPGIDDAGKRCWHQFQEASVALFRALHERLLDAHQLALIDVLLLDRIAKSTADAVPMSTLGEEFALTPSGVTQHIARLESDGLVHRGPGQGDRRRVVARITAPGRARLGPALYGYAKEIRRLYLDPMSHQQAIALGDACRRISVPLKSGTGRPV
ncbi:MarR family winged helix-turn-helix transcriptional regulator [[Mycobacterium] nativiensis]|uniref:MarR family transcriptional regulator n=1 Tax=[Mycobacterium] nativiensis TaxID=2855503 RepID=A0ABU5Y070_9MYCO|nr:MarR family transcriptional regulator [Mycolicibacter sp. MYC340]MEB3033412.1 MarR family transcriptional regulator [Mycolicibacter sp. MYC340]